MALPAMSPPAADRNDQDIEIGHLLQHFQRDGALAGNNVAVS